jgi:NAD binding domain of 6-phosphogluconate dehydrogenase
MPADTPVQLGMIGLGRMGANLVRRLMRDGHRCVAYDRNPGVIKSLGAEEATAASLYERFESRDASVFFAIAQVFGAVGPILFGALIGAGNNPSRLFIGYAIGGGLMIVGGIVELLLGVAAERKELEQIARPLTAVTATQVPRAPMPRTHYSPSSKPGGPSSAAA